MTGPCQRTSIYLCNRMFIVTMLASLLPQWIKYFHFDYVKVCLIMKKKLIEIFFLFISNTYIPTISVRLQRLLIQFFNTHSRRSQYLKKRFLGKVWKFLIVYSRFWNNRSFEIWYSTRIKYFTHNKACSTAMSFYLRCMRLFSVNNNHSLTMNFIIMNVIFHGNSWDIGLKIDTLPYFRWVP